MRANSSCIAGTFSGRPFEITCVRRARGAACNAGGARCAGGWRSAHPPAERSRAATRLCAQGAAPPPIGAAAVIHLMCPLSSVASTRVLRRRSGAFLFCVSGRSGARTAKWNCETGSCATPPSAQTSSAACRMVARQGARRTQRWMWRALRVARRVSQVVRSVKVWGKCCVGGCSIRAAWQADE